MVNLQNWVKQAREHWKEFQPKRYSALVKSGKLEAALQDAAERTYRELTELEDQGFDHQDAWEIVRERYLFVPEEGKNPTAYSESYFNRPTLATVLHEAIATGARTMDIPQPSGPSPQPGRCNMEDDRPRINIISSAELDPVVESRPLGPVEAIVLALVVGLVLFFVFGG